MYYSSVAIFNSPFRNTPTGARRKLEIQKQGKAVEGRDPIKIDVITQTDI